MCRRVLWMNNHKFKDYSEKPDIKIKKVWHKVNVIGYSIMSIIVIFVMILGYIHQWNKVILIGLISLFFIILGLFILESIFIKKIKYNLISFEFTNGYIVIQKASLFFSKIIVVPFEKIYFIDFKTGPILKKYNLCNLKIGTMAYQHEIEGIDIYKADSYKDYIYKYSSNL